MSDSHTDDPKVKKSVQTYAFGAILVVLLFMVGRLFAPFFTVFLWSTLLYVLLSPLHQRIVKKINLSGRKEIIAKNIWAALFSLGTMILILIPVLFVSAQFFRQITELIRTTRDSLNHNPGIIKNMLERLSEFIRDITSDQIIISANEIQQRLVASLSSSLQNLIQMSSGVARNVGAFFAGLVFMLFCLFFFYLDGPYLSKLFFHVIPIRKEYLDALVMKFKDITRNLFLGYIMVALIQSVVAYVIFILFRIKGALVFAGLSLICAFIPMFGTALVWMPLGIPRIFNRHLAGGIVFLIVSALFISTLDNFVRPIFLRDRIHLHPLIIFFSILGGVQAFGFNGLVLGPIVVILFLTVLDLFLTEHMMKPDNGGTG